jgi:hypothetical protein
VETVKLYVIDLNRLSHFPGNCGIQTQTVFFINATGKGKVVYTVESQPDQDNEATEGNFPYFSILLYQVPYFSNSPLFRQFVAFQTVLIPV